MLKNIVEFPLIFIDINDVNLKDYFKYVVGKLIETVLVIYVINSILFGKTILRLFPQISHVILVLRGKTNPTAYFLKEYIFFSYVDILPSYEKTVST